MGAMKKAAPALALGAGVIALLLASTSKAEVDKLAELEDAGPGEPNLLELYEAIMANPEGFTVEEILGVAEQLEKAGFPIMADNLRDLAAGLSVPESPPLQPEPSLPPYYDIKGDGTDLWPWDLAELYTGNGARWPELCEANPELPKHPEWGCVYPPSGRLNIPEQWLNAGT